MRAFLSKYRQYAALVLAALLVGIDQLTKWLVVSNMEMYNVVPLIKIDGVEVLNLFYCTNNGSAFSMMEGKTAFLIGITSLVIVALIVGLVTKRIQRGTYVTAVALIIGGGTGNLIDRLFNNGYTFIAVNNVYIHITHSLLLYIRMQEPLCPCIPL